MNAHKNARSTRFGRAVMVRRVLDDGWTVAAAASAFAVSTRTVRKWLARFRSDGLAGLQSRSSAPRLVGNKLPAPWVDRIVRLRRDYRMAAPPTCPDGCATTTSSDPMLVSHAEGRDAGRAAARALRHLGGRHGRRPGQAGAGPGQRQRLPHLAQGGTGGGQEHRPRAS